MRGSLLLVGPALGLLLMPSPALSLLLSPCRCCQMLRSRALPLSTPHRKPPRITEKDCRMSRGADATPAASLRAVRRDEASDTVNVLPRLRAVAGALMVCTGLILLLSSHVLRLVLAAGCGVLLSAYLLWMQPVGESCVGPCDIFVASSAVSGKGLFAARDLGQGLVLGTYPGRVWRKRTWRRFKGLRIADFFMGLRHAKQRQRQSRAQEYIWLLEDDKIIDPTDHHGLLQPYVPSLHSALHLSTPVRTHLCRINEPPRKWARYTQAPNVEARLDANGGVQLFLTRNVSAREELWLSYGSEYNRSGYAPGLWDRDMLIVPSYQKTSGGSSARIRMDSRNSARASNFWQGPMESGGEHQFDNAPRRIWFVKPQLYPEIDNSTCL